MRASKSMDASPLGPVEDFLIRMSLEVRQQYGLEIGDAVKVGDKILRVGWAYENDLEAYPAEAYLTTKVYRELFGSSTPLEKVTELTFGADPEAFLVNGQGSLVDAGLHFTNGVIGHDQGLIEFRPNPATDAKTLLSNLYGAIFAAQYILNSDDVRIYATSMYLLQPAGFHVHFGIPLKDDLSLFMDRLGHLLDFFLSLVSVWFESGKEYERRTLTAYGSPSDVRESEHSWEYRTVGGHMLADPRLALLVLAISETVSKDLFLVYKDFPEVLDGINLYKAYPTLPSPEIMEKVLNSHKCKTFANRYIDDIIRYIDLMGSYNIQEYFEKIRNIKVDRSNVWHNWMWHTREALSSLRVQV